MVKTEQQLYDFCKAHYYSDVADGLLWEPFENYDIGQVEE